MTLTLPMPTASVLLVEHLVPTFGHLQEEILSKLAEQQVDGIVHATTEVMLQAAPLHLLVTTTFVRQDLLQGLLSTTGTQLINFGMGSSVRVRVHAAAVKILHGGASSSHVR